ncbi:MAG: hypothetical protein ACLUEK_10215 [Oscillospiraceae bacterium]
MDKYNDSIKVYESSTANRYYFTMPDSNVVNVVMRHVQPLHGREHRSPMTRSTAQRGHHGRHQRVHVLPNNATSRGGCDHPVASRGQPVVTGTSPTSSSAFITRS